MKNATVGELRTALDAELVNIEAKRTHPKTCDHPKCMEHRELGMRLMDMSNWRTVAAGNLPPDECPVFWALEKEHERLDQIIRPWHSRSMADYSHDEHVQRLEVAGLPYPYTRGLQGV